MFRRHYTDEQLLAFLDTELDPVWRALVSRHVKACWICRSRLSDLEDQVQTLSSTWREAGLNQPVEVEQARNRFLAWTRAGAFDFGSGGWWRFSAILRAPAMAGIGAILLVGGVTVWELQQREKSVLPVDKQPAAGVAPRPLATVPPARQPAAEVARLERATAPAEIASLPRAGPSESQLLEAEVEAWWLLHRAGACNGEPIEIKRDGENRILIQGIVPTGRRRNELLRSLEEINGREVIRIELDSAESLRPVSARVAMAALPPQRSGPPAGDSEFQGAARAALRSIYPLDTDEESRRRLVGISNRAIRLSENASAEAWAIRRLGERFHDGASLKLPAQSRQLLETMAREHVLALRGAVADAGALLAPMLSRIAPGEAPPVSPLDLFSGVERLRILVQTSLIGNSPAPGPPAEASLEIAALTKSLAADLSDLDAAVARIVPEP